MDHTYLVFLNILNFAFTQVSITKIFTNLKVNN